MPYDPSPSRSMSVITAALPTPYIYYQCYTRHSIIYYKSAQRCTNPNKLSYATSRHNTSAGAYIDQWCSVSAYIYIYIQVYMYFYKAIHIYTYINIYHQYRCNLPQWAIEYVQPRLTTSERSECMSSSHIWLQLHHYTFMNTCHTITHIIYIYHHMAWCFAIWDTAGLAQW